MQYNINPIKILNHNDNDNDNDNALYFLFNKYNTIVYNSAQMNDTTAAASSQNVQFQQMQLMDQATQMINNANMLCAKGTDCYKQQQITDAQNKYTAALITAKKAPETVEAARKNFLVASKGQTVANQELMRRYEKNGEAEKAKLTQQFDEWFNDMTNKMNTGSMHAETITALQTSNDTANHFLSNLKNQADDTTNELNLLERKTHYLGQNIKMINGIEYYVKLVYWLAFLTWMACILYDRAFTMKTAALFVLFTCIIFAQNWIMNAAASALSSFM
jgi:hypothetical protein